MIIDTGLYRFRLNGAPGYCYREIHNLYGQSVGRSPESPIDFQLDFAATSLLRKVVRPQVVLTVDNQRIFNPIARDKCLPSVEWGMNWCVASYDQTRLLIHSSVIVKNGKAIVFPAAQGSGKSTLSTLLGLGGWQLFSDEMAIIETDTGRVLPVHRAASLKNESIDVVRQHFPSATRSIVTQGTQKGAIGHVQVHTRQDYDTFASAPIAAVVCPKFIKGAQTEIVALNQSQGFAQLVRNSFNYSTLGEQGFETMYKVVKGAAFSTIQYSDVSEIEQYLETLI